MVCAGCVLPTGENLRRAVFEAPGPQADGSVLLPNQWYLRPVGRQVVLGDFPVNIALHPNGRYAAVLHCGHGQHEIVIVEVASAKLVCRVAVEESFYGIEFSRDGTQLFSSGASDEVIHTFSFAGGYPANLQSIRVRDLKERGIPAGLAVSSDAKTLFVANLWGQRVSQIDLMGRANVGDIQLGTNASPVSARGGERTISADEDAITKRAEALLDQTTSADPFPYACVLDEKRNRLYVSLWAQSAVAVVDLKSKAVVGRWTTEEHPNEMLLSKSGARLFVANANRNTVSVIDTDTGRTMETLVAELRPNSLPGSTPNSLALSPDEKLLFVANANINAVAVFDVSVNGQSQSLGFIPVGWYPTSVRVTPDGKRLLVANGKGIISKANRYGPQPGRDVPATVREYIGGLFRGTLSVIDLPSREKFEEQMKRHTAQAYRSMPKSAGEWPASEFVNNPVPRKIGDSSPIKYCFYIIKENRTYDQVLGDMPEGNGDPSLCLFPERITPNHHKLAREFVLLDNFYVESEVSADGHEWTMGAYATDFVEKSWPMSYGHNRRNKYPYPSEGNFAIARPAGGYLWDRAREAKVSYRSYGEFINNGPTPDQPGTSRVAALEGHFDPWYRGFDMDYPDSKRADRFIAELNRFEREGEMPRLQIVRLPNDHTSGTSLGKPTPTAYLADNDLALGRVVEAITRSKFWPQTAIFVVEDDAQNGPDHVDAHRTIAYVISPFVKRGSVDSTMYSTASMLRTIELILGLKPMSQFDAAAMPMFRCFQSKSDSRAYKAVPITVDVNEKNVKTAWGGKFSEQMDFTQEDVADDLLLNEVVWRSVRGPDSPMPAPTRAAFVFTRSVGDGGED
ncbi:MAG: beta-propeller fold lactonase family protein [Verrucomicrobia bacterium]|nr:beta-propeller fold lactonase family protein [Verrucomicrobiota bacterium]